MTAYFISISCSSRGSGLCSAPALEERAEVEFLDDIEDGWNKESADECLCDHPADDSRPDHLASNRPSAGRGPERHATKNERERCHQERTQAKPRCFECGIGQRPSLFI